MIVVVWVMVGGALFLTLNAGLSFWDGARPVLSWIRLEFALLAWWGAGLALRLA